MQRQVNTYPNKLDQASLAIAAGQAWTSLVNKLILVIYIYFVLINVTKSEVPDSIPIDDFNNLMEEVINPRLNSSNDTICWLLQMVKIINTIYYYRDNLQDSVAKILPISEFFEVYKTNFGLMYSKLEGEGVTSVYFPKYKMRLGGNYEYWKLYPNDYYTVNW